MKAEDVKLIMEAPAVVLTTISSSGYPQSRNMLNLRNPVQFPSLVNFFKLCSMEDYFFSTNTSSNKINDIRYNNKACAYFSDPGTWHGLTLTGDIFIVDDQEVKRALWQSNWDMYYEGGLGSPDYTILHLKIRQANKYYQLEKSIIDLSL